MQRPLDLETFDPDAASNQEYVSKTARMASSELTMSYVSSAYCEMGERGI